MLMGGIQMSKAIISDESKSSAKRRGAIMPPEIADSDKPRDELLESAVLGPTRAHASNEGHQISSCRGER